MKVLLTILMILGFLIEPVLGKDISDWEIVHERQSVVVSERWISQMDGMRRRERKAELIVRSNPDDILGLIKNEKRTKQWMKPVKTHQNIKVSGPWSWTSYTIYSIPWPFKAQDMLSRYDCNPINHDSKGYLIRIASVDQDLTENRIANRVEKKRLKRLNNYWAEWHIEELSPGRCFVSFTSSSLDSPPFPRWMMDPVLIKLLEDNLIRFRELAQKSD